MFAFYRYKKDLRFVSINSKTVTYASVIYIRALFTICARSAVSETRRNRILPYANIINFGSIETFIISLMQKLKGSGPKMLPCTPDVAGLKAD